jgi:hypothetical protein
MGGQDGFSRDMLNYTSESNTVMAGFKYGTNEKFEIGADLSWMAATSGLDPFDLSADDYVATHPPMSYDFSQSHTYSDIDSTRLDAQLWAQFWFGGNKWVRVRYHMVDFADDAPYLYDTTGQYQYGAASFGMSF